MRLWTKQARKNAKFATNQATAFSKRCMCYYYIRKECTEDPSLITLSYDALRNAAQQSLVSRKRKQSGDAEEGEGEDGGDLLRGEWFDLAVAVSEAYIT